MKKNKYRTEETIPLKQNKEEYLELVKSLEDSISMIVSIIRYCFEDNDFILYSNLVHNITDSAHKIIAFNETRDH